MITLRQPVKMLQSGLVKGGYVRACEIGEPMAPPNDFTGSIIMSGVTMPGLTLSGTIEERTVTLRVYANALSDEREETEFKLDEIQANLIEALLGDFDLGSSIRNIEAVNIVVKYGYQTIGQVIFRVMDILIPMVIDDSAAQSN